MLNTDKLSADLMDKLRTLGSSIFFKKTYKPLSEYARALACLFYYRFDGENIPTIAKHYVKSQESDYVLRKYLIFVSLTVGNAKLREKVLNKAKIEQNLSISRLVNFLLNIDNYKKDSKKKKILNDYFKKTKICMIYKKDVLIDEEDYSPVRMDILNDLINCYSE